MKNYYAILEVPVGCGVAEIRSAYQRLMQENGDNGAVLADLNEAHEVLTTPTRRVDYDRAVWGETFAGDSDGAGFAPSGAEGATLLPGATLLAGATLLPGVLAPSALLAGMARCPMGAEAQCPVLLKQAGQMDTYCPECGYLLAGFNSAGSFESSSMAEGDEGLRLEETGGRSHRLRPGLNMVGRESADVLLPDKTVSRQHARLEVGEDGTVTIEDMSSTNGTQVGGDVLVPHIPRTLQAGDRVRFGSVITVLHLPTSTSPDFGAATPGADAGSGFGAEGFPSPLGAAALEAGASASHAKARAQVVETREEGGRAYPLVPGVTTFGRRAENSVVLQGDPYVSGSHAQIIADGDVFRMTDIGSTNGTLLNGQRLAINEPVTLSPDDVILIGGTAMRFELLDVIEEPPVNASETGTLETDALETDAPKADTMKMDAVEGEAVEGEAGTTEKESAPAEPRERIAPEYDIPEDDGVTESSPEQNSAAHDSPTHDSPTHDSPMQAER